MFKKIVNSSKTCSCRCCCEELSVKPNLALSPAQCLEMSDRGIPVTSANSRDFYDGEPSPSWNVSPERVRGVDPADLWQAQQSARRKIRQSYKNDVATYGVNSKQS